MRVSVCASLLVIFCHLVILPPLGLCEQEQCTWFVCCILQQKKTPLSSDTIRHDWGSVCVCVLCKHSKTGATSVYLVKLMNAPPFFCCKINTDTFFGEAFLFLLTAPCGKLRSGSSIFSACVLFFLPLSLTIYLMYALSTPRNAILCKIFSSFEITRVHWPQSTGYL